MWLAQPLPCLKHTLFPLVLTVRSAFLSPAPVAPQVPARPLWLHLLSLPAVACILATSGHRRPWTSAVAPRSRQMPSPRLDPVRPPLPCCSHSPCRSSPESPFGLRAVLAAPSSLAAAPVPGAPGSAAVRALTPGRGDSPVLLRVHRLEGWAVSCSRCVPSSSHRAWHVADKQSILVTSAVFRRLGCCPEHGIRPLASPSRRLAAATFRMLSGEPVWGYF